MAVYSYFLLGGARRPPVQFEIEQDSSATALSICLLRDEPDIAQVWIIENREPVAVRIRSADSEIGMLVDLRVPAQPDAAVCA